MVSGNRGTVSVTSRLLVDCMGHYSPVVRQMRGRARPEGMVLVVGSCATGERLNGKGVKGVIMVIGIEHYRVVLVVGSCAARETCRGRGNGVSRCQ